MKSYAKIFYALLIAILLITLTVSYIWAQAPVDSPHTIYLRSRTFTPARGVDPALVAAAQSLQARGEGRMHVLLQFNEHPDTAQRTQVEREGTRLLAYLPDYAWHASVPIDVAIAGQLPPGVRWMGAIQPLDKIDPILQTNPPQAGEPLRLIITIYADTDIGAARVAVEALGGTVLDAIPEIEQLYVEMPDGSSLTALTASDLWYWIAPEAGPPQPRNQGGRAATKTDQVHNLGFHGNPAAAPGSIVLGIWDDGIIDPSHPDFTGRVVFSETGVAVGTHGMHVAGTMAGNGAASPAGKDYRGHADQARIVSYDFQGNVPTEHQAAITTYGLDISQNSWGTGDTNICDPNFGQYLNNSRTFDQIVNGLYNKRIVVDFAAGNQQQNCPGGWSTGDPEGSAKNVVAVGATHSVDKTMTNFSSWGPTKDGRIKPDVVAPGATNAATNITSTMPFIGWAVGQNGTVLRTTGGGRTWSAQTSGTTQHILGVHGRPNNETRGWIVGASGVISTYDGSNNTWISQNSGTGNNLNSVFFSSDNFGWAVGTGGVIVATGNGGGAWGPQASGTANELWSIHAIDDNNAWAVGDNGTIINTANGVNWAPQTSGTTNHLYDVYFANGNDGWVVGQGGVISTTFNGGTNWTAQTSGTAQDLRAVFFVSGQNGWAVGFGGTIIKTTNGGTNWNAQTSGTANNLYDVFAADSQNAWAVGDGGTILHTTDGGANWNAQTSNTAEDINHIYFSYSSRYGGQPYQGTSMATPAVSGIMGLLLEAYNKTYQNADPWPSTLKGVLIHTAEDLGNPGPDYKFGYGHVDALAAVKLITATTNGTSNFMKQASVANGATQTYKINSAAAISPTCTLVWDDKEGTVGAGKALVNDLDLRLVAPDNTTHLPWTLDPTNGNQDNNATRADNDVDNVEQVVPTATQAGEWRVQVIGDSVPQGPEEFSLVCSEAIASSQQSYVPIILKN